MQGYEQTSHVFVNGLLKVPELHSHSLVLESKYLADEQVRQVVPSSQVSQEK